MDLEGIHVESRHIGVNEVSNLDLNELGHSGNYALWSDNPASLDLLAFSPVAETVAAALLDDQLDPVVLGVSGRWGSGKTTVLQLVGAELAKSNDEGSRILIVPTDPWRYDPATGVKESLISEVLSALESEVDGNAAEGSNAKELFKRLVRRVDWAKAITLAAKSSLLMQIPSIGDIAELVKDPGGTSGDQSRGLEAFRNEFKQLMESPDLGHIKRVVVLVDDLDRCLPPTVIETLEGIRLFLAVPKMSFVIAADEERVADAIRTRYEKPGGSAERSASEIEEEPARLYLHKIVHTTVPLPALSRFDTETYLLLLQVLPKVDESRLKKLVEQCDSLRKASRDLGELDAVDGVDLGAERAFAERLTPILYEKLRGNPRRIKRFLNDLRVRQSIAARRGIDLQADIVAKMMVLEQLLPEEFERLLGWLANGTLRSEMSRLEEAAGQPPSDVEESTGEDEDDGVGALGGGDVDEADDAAPPQQTFTDQLLRWAKLTPALRTEDLSAYLHLAASFAGQTVLDRDLPERLRDLAARLLSGVRADQYSIVDSDLRLLPPDDAKPLLQHLGRMGRDRPVDQLKAIQAILRISRQQTLLADECCSALAAIPADEVTLPALMLFDPGNKLLRPALVKWLSQTTKETTRNAINSVLAESG